MNVSTRRARSFASIVRIVLNQKPYTHIKKQQSQLKKRKKKKRNEHFNETLKQNGPAKCKCASERGRRTERKEEDGAKTHHIYDPCGNKKLLAQAF